MRNSLFDVGNPECERFLIRIILIVDKHENLDESRQRCRQKLERQSFLLVGHKLDSSLFEQEQIVPVGAQNKDSLGRVRIGVGDSFLRGDISACSSSRDWKCQFKRFWYNWRLTVDVDEPALDQLRHFNVHNVYVVVFEARLAWLNAYV